MWINSPLTPPHPTPGCQCRRQRAVARTRQHHAVRGRHRLEPRRRRRRRWWHHIGLRPIDALISYETAANVLILLCFLTGHDSGHRRH